MFHHSPAATGRAQVRRLAAGLAVSAFAALTLAAAAPMAGASPVAGTAARATAATRSDSAVRLGDPASSFNPGASFDDVCVVRGHAGACNAVALADIDQARQREGIGPMVLPRAFPSWSTISQLRWVTNQERTARGLPALTLSTPLNQLASLGAAEGQDPTGPADATWGSNISFGYTTALAADFAWMYDDGANSPNLDCPSAAASGCWGHRRNILAAFSGVQGEAVYAKAGVLQMTELFVAN